MVNDKTFGMYIEYTDIPDKDLKEEFDVSIESLLTSTLLEKDADGWYYPNAIVHGKQENVRAFLFLVATELTKFHKYITKLLFKCGDRIMDYKAEVEDAGQW